MGCSSSLERVNVIQTQRILPTSSPENAMFSNFLTFVRHIEINNIVIFQLKNTKKTIDWGPIRR